MCRFSLMVGFLMFTCGNWPRLDALSANKETKYSAEATRISQRGPSAGYPISTRAWNSHLYAKWLCPGRYEPTYVHAGACQPLSRSKAGLGIRDALLRWTVDGFCPHDRPIIPWRADDGPCSLP